jgi:hypothetical protein
VFALQGLKLQFDKPPLLGSFSFGLQDRSLWSSFRSEAQPRFSEFALSMTTASVCAMAAVNWGLSFRGVMSLLYVEREIETERLFTFTLLRHGN